MLCHYLCDWRLSSAPNSSFRGSRGTLLMWVADALRRRGSVPTHGGSLPRPRPGPNPSWPPAARPSDRSGPGGSQQGPSNVFVCLYFIHQRECQYVRTYLRKPLHALRAHPQHPPNLAPPKALLLKAPPSSWNGWPWTFNCLKQCYTI